MRQGVELALFTFRKETKTPTSAAGLEETELFPDATTTVHWIFCVWIPSPQAGFASRPKVLASAGRSMT